MAKHDSRRGDPLGDSLFSQSQDLSQEPLASRMRPRTLEEFVGQDHILGPGRLLRRAIQADRLTSIILYGPPGTGKTTLARVIANTTQSDFLSLNAVLSGVKEVREAIEKARRTQELYGRRTILFVDEVHRWNKAQQDALLPWLENGTIIFIGATTENPFFEVISALVSRSRVFQLKPLTAENLRTLAHRALKDPVRGYGKYQVEITEEALEHLINVADGDARNLLNALELAIETTSTSFPPAEGETIQIDRAIAEESIQKRAVLYDKEGDYHYDTISAFIKSLRGSDPDAALYWMARMIRSGEDPHFIFRRMLILASEDVGLADPQALVVVEAAARAFDRVGMPEGQFHLTQAALYLATCPKSNSSLGYFDALKAVEEEGIRDVPSHLKDASRDAEGFGHGQGYKYPHAFRDHWVAQNYLPQELRGRIFYHPAGQGYEGKIQAQVLARREVLLHGLVEEPDEAFTFTPKDRSKEEWLSRFTGGGGKILESVRTKVFSFASLKRHERVLLVGRGMVSLVGEAVRQTPEGWVVGVARSRKEQELASRAFEVLPEVERPRILLEQEMEQEMEALGLRENAKEIPQSIFGLEKKGAGNKDSTEKPEEVQPTLPVFDVLICQGFWGLHVKDKGREGLVEKGQQTQASTGKASKEQGVYFVPAREMPKAYLSLLAPEGRVVWAEPLLTGSSRLFAAYFETYGLEDLPKTLQERLLQIEEEYYCSLPLYLQKVEEFVSYIGSVGLKVLQVEEASFEEKREILKRNLEDWFGLSNFLSPDSQDSTEAGKRFSDGETRIKVTQELPQHPFAQTLRNQFGEEEREILYRWIGSKLPARSLTWKQNYVFCVAKKRSP
ncbi:MAG: AAA family ATPase [Spirochaetales bacterium]